MKRMQPNSTVSTRRRPQLKTMLVCRQRLERDPGRPRRAPVESRHPRSCYAPPAAFTASLLPAEPDLHFSPVRPLMVPPADPGVNPLPEPATQRKSPDVHQQARDGEGPEGAGSPARWGTISLLTPVEPAVMLTLAWPPLF